MLVFRRNKNKKSFVPFSSTCLIYTIPLATFTCEVCPKPTSFKARKALNNHKLDYHSDSFKFKFVSQKGMKMNVAFAFVFLLINNFDADETKIVEVIRSDEGYRCPFCCKNWKTVSGVKKHLQRKMENFEDKIGEWIS